MYTMEDIQSLDINLLLFVIIILLIMIIAKFVANELLTLFRGRRR